MAREKIRTTREDSTGFHGPKKPANKSPLPLLDKIPIKRFMERCQRVSDKPLAPTLSSPDNAALQVEIEEDISKSVPKTETPSDQSQSDKLASIPVAVEDAPHHDATDLVELDVPHAEKAKKIYLILRLRVLERHVEKLAKLEETGIDPDKVLQTAFREMPKIEFQPECMPQVLEPSGPARWTYRCNMQLSPETLRAIEAQVRGGAATPRSALLLG